MKSESSLPGSEQCAGVRCI